MIVLLLAYRSLRNRIVTTCLSVLSLALSVMLSPVSGAVLIIGLLALLAALYATVHERRREVAVLRALGLQSRQIFALFVLESALVSAVGTILGLASIYGVLHFTHHPQQAAYGIPLLIATASSRVSLYAASIIVAGGLVGCIPAMRAYLDDRANGLNAR